MRKPRGKDKQIRRGVVAGVLSYPTLAKITGFKPSTIRKAIKGYVAISGIKVRDMELSEVGEFIHYAIGQKHKSEDEQFKTEQGFAQVERELKRVK